MNNSFTTLILLILLGFSNSVIAQHTEFDSLRGTITPERAWWDLQHYHLDINVSPADSSISGHNTIRYLVLDSLQKMQIDLQGPLVITKVTQDGEELNWVKKGFAHFVELSKKQVVGESHEVTIFYEGKPRISRLPPWVGGLTWKKNKNNQDWVVTTCQGDGASLWWPCKDHMYDEVDSMKMSITVPDHLMDVSNGRLIKETQHEDNRKTYVWEVKNPINNYGVNINIGEYAHFSEEYEGLEGTLDLDYYVMPYNLEAAKSQFKQVPMLLDAFEHWFGPYPFYEDGFKIVEVPYPGMEHQSSVTYGNGYKNGYGGRDVSFTGWGQKFDFILIHESGHEWFANSITYKDVADMWVHEGFTSYSENLYLDYHFGKKASSEYVIGQRTNILNDIPIIGPYDVNKEGSNDMYNKGANILHTIRQLVNDDEKWRQVLLDMNKTFYHQTVTSQQIENFISEKIGINLQHFFDVYLRTTDIPVLEYQWKRKKLKYRWASCNKDFDIPVKVIVDGKSFWLSPNNEWQSIKHRLPIIDLETDPNFYVKSKRL